MPLNINTTLRPISSTTPDRGTKRGPTVAPERVTEPAKRARAASARFDWIDENYDNPNQSSTVGSTLTARAMLIIPIAPSTQN